MSTSEARARLALQQAELVRALVARGAAPPGFAAERLDLVARSLINKRLREVARVWPALVRCLGDRWAERFRAFARITPPPAEGGPAADGRAFAGTLSGNELDDAARLELLSVDLHRRRLALKVRWLPEAGRVVLGVRLPWLGVRVVSLRAARRWG